MPHPSATLFYCPGWGLELTQTRQAINAHRPLGLHFISCAAIIAYYIYVHLWTSDGMPPDVWELLPRAGFCDRRGRVPRVGSR